MACEPDLIFDIGSHKGEDTDFYLKKGFKVVAFEVNAELITHCKARFGDAIADGRLRLVEGAIAPEAAGERIALYKNVQASDWSTINANWAERNRMLGKRSVKVEVERVDIVQAFRTYGIPFYLKIDIEGADHVVLDGLRHLEGRPRYISIEAEKVDFARLIAELNALRDLGYQRFSPVQQARIAGTRIATETIRGDPLDYVFEDRASGPFGDDLPGPWLSYEECIREYRRIFRLYRLFGDYSILHGVPGGRRFIGLLERLLRQPLPGWYDTHAKLEH
jgi:FkbM family methyltransferase